MKTISGVLPWLVAMTAAGGVIWWMLARDMAAGKWLLAGLLFAHGAVHLLFAVPQPASSSDTSWPFDMTRSWLGGANARTLGWVLIILTITAFTIAALATAGVAIPSGWWQPAVITAALISVVVLGVYFDPQLVVGFGINAALVWVAAGAWWVPA